jgi:hypothetical protein
MWGYKQLYLVSPTGVEPVTFGFGGQRSIQLSYGRESAPMIIPDPAGVKLAALLRR